MASEKKDFLVPYTIRSFTSRMTKNQKADFWDAVLAYEIDGQEPKLEKDLMYAFWFIQDYLKEKREHYEEVGKQRAEAGRKGGYAKAEKMANVANANKSGKTWQKRQNVHDYDNDNEYSSVPEVQKNTNTKSDLTINSAPFRLIGEPAKRPEHEKTRMTRTQFEEMFSYMKNPDLRKMAMDNALEKGFYEIIDEDSGDL